jgi:ribose transport system ATP-binding protein
MDEVLLEIRKLNKRFGATHANKDIDFTLRKGEIRGLAGENGSGKSTLLSQIAGIYGSDSGEMFINGKPYAPTSPLHANDCGIAIVVQELGLVGSLPAGINVFLGKTKQFSRFGIISLKKVYAAVNEQLNKWGLPSVPYRKLAGELSVETRKMVELARALSCDPQILILDEVTQALSHDNREILYSLIKRFKDMGRSVIVISHDLEELIRITDTISILRDGELIDTVPSSSLSLDELKTRMVGRKIEGDYYRSDNEASSLDEVVLSVRDVCTENLEDINFEVKKGEIFGFCGLSDSGIHELGQVLYGLSGKTRGVVELNGVNLTRPEQALENRVAYVPKDRDGEALMMKASIMHNFCLASVEELRGRFGYLSRRALQDLAQQASDRFSVKSTGISQLMSGLSGGNKQKVNLGRWLIKDIQLLIVDCPTRGVDVGVKAYIYECLRQSKASGIAIVLITDELSEAIGMADRLAVMKNGRIQKIIERGDQMNEEAIIEVMA